MSSSTKVWRVSAGSHKSSAAHYGMNSMHPALPFMCNDVPGAHGKATKDASICQWIAQCACTRSGNPSPHAASTCCYVHSISSMLHKVLCYTCLAHKTPNSCLCTLTAVRVRKLLVSPEAITLDTQRATRGECVPVRRYCTALRPVELG